jgi:hypothetical protein
LRNVVRQLRFGVRRLRIGVPRLRHGFPRLRFVVRRLQGGVPRLRNAIRRLRFAVRRLRGAARRGILGLKRAWGAILMAANLRTTPCQTVISFGTKVSSMEPISGMGLRPTKGGAE